MGKIKDFTGEKIGLLQVLSLEKERKNGYAVWKCLCDCGNICYKKSIYLKRYPSCGCLGKKSMIEKNKKHGMVYSKEYNSWQETNYLLQNKANRYALAHSISQLGDHEHLLTPEQFEAQAAND